MFVQLYIFKKSDGLFLYQDTGNPAQVINDLGDDKNFTLTPPPDNSKVWRWVDDHWE